ncbi:membrane metallo-endopeptidase-like 1 isoform X3 [Dermacentor silvarum]|uniref:membrane metallo-endopeptidase-like 1 isoform X3 n=1 Tax=Dermacentor silvarum TaxID=543639 RepID=UPI00210108A2|nr:membrane metallo-endopeptidase-like 1 isoform X3 [Dermacentor silvarum]
MKTIESKVIIALWIFALGMSQVLVESRRAHKAMPTTYHKDTKKTKTSYSSNVCKTKACEHRAKYITAALNKDYKPCDSFYDHVCSNWMFYNPIPDDKSTASVLEGIDDKLTEDLKGIFENTTYKMENQNATDKVLGSYKNCMNTSIPEATQFYALIDVLKRVGGEYWPVWPPPKAREVLPTWDQLYTKIHNEFAINLLFIVGVDKDPKNVSNKIISILEAAENKTGTDLNFFRMTIADLRNISEHVDWLQMLQRLFDSVNVTLTPEEPVVLNELYYFKTLVDYITKNTSRHTTYNYMIWRLIRNFGPMALPKMRQLSFKMTQAARGVKRDIPLSTRCVYYISDVMDFPAGRLYVERYFSKEAKKDILNLVNELKEAFSKSIRRTKWMDESTKIHALKKLETMVTHVGYSDDLLNDTYLNNMFKEVIDAKPGQPFILNYVSFRKQWAKINLMTLHKPYSREEWSSGPAVVNAYYYPQLNGITFPAGILRPPVFEYGVPMYINMGGIGAVIGHEVTHAFDDTGSQFDSDGNMKNWWTNKTREKFLEKMTCFKEQYGNITDERLKVKLNGKKTVGENTADNGGIHQAYHAYRAWAKKHKVKSLPGLESFTADQLFFISVALTWCNNPRPRRLQQQIDSDVHAPSRYRVNVPLSNMEEFSKAFKCPKDSPMYSKRKCVLW